MIRGALTTIIAVGALGTVGCKQVGPDFAEPAADVNSNWQLFESERIKTRAPQSVEWWQAFDDPVLENLVEAAFAQNLSLEAAGLQVLEARAQLGIAVGQMFPQQQNVTGAAIYSDRSERGANTAGSDSSLRQHDLGLSVVGSWTSGGVFAAAPKPRSRACRRRWTSPATRSAPCCGRSANRTYGSTACCSCRAGSGSAPGYSRARA